MTLKRYSEGKKYFNQRQQMTPLQKKVKDKEVQMSARKQKITKKKVKAQTAATSAVSALTRIKDKFVALQKVRAKIAEMKQLYIKHNELMEELMPLFIEIAPDEFIIKREIKIGTKKYRFTPFFYDEKKGTVVPKVWKSTAFESGTIE